MAIARIKKIESRYVAEKMIKIKTRKISSIRNDSKKTTEIAGNMGMLQKITKKMRETRVKYHNDIRKELGT